jgi:hypothetical protein
MSFALRKSANGKYQSLDFCDVFSILIRIFIFLLLPWSNATHLSVFVTGVGVINEIVVEPRATLRHQIIKI